MTKRVVWLASAVLVIALGTFFYVATSHSMGDEYPSARFVSAVLLLIVAVAFRRHGSLLARALMLCGSAALVLAYAHDLFIELGLRHEWFQSFGDGWIFYGYGESRERPLIAIPAGVLRIFGFCFPVGLLLLAL